MRASKTGMFKNKMYYLSAEHGVHQLRPAARTRYVHMYGHKWVTCTLYICRRHAAPTQAQVRLHWTAWRFDLSSVNYRRSCLSCCWSKGVEWPAKRCYVGLVAVGVQEQAEDILVPPLLRNCLTFNFIPLYIHLYSPVGRSIHNIKRNNKPKYTKS